MHNALLTQVKINKNRCACIESHSAEYSSLFYRWKSNIKKLTNFKYYSFLPEDSTWSTSRQPFTKFILYSCSFVRLIRYNLLLSRNAETFVWNIKIPMITFRRQHSKTYLATCSIIAVIHPCPIIGRDVHSVYFDLCIYIFDSYIIPHIYHMCGTW